MLVDGSRFHGALPCLLCRHARRRKSADEWQQLCGRCRNLRDDELDILYWYQTADYDRVVVPPNILRHSRENSDARYSAARVALDELGIAKGSRLLDIGCGVSAQAELFRDFSYVGADLNRPRLGRGRRTNSWAQYAVQNVIRMGWREGVFDAALCLEVIEHVPPAARQTLVEEIFRVLSPTGVLVLSTPDGGLTGWKLLFGRKAERAHETELDQAEVRTLVTRAGGTLLTVRAVDNLILPAGRASYVLVQLVAGRPRWRGMAQRIAARAGYRTLLYVAQHHLARRPGDRALADDRKGATA